MKRHRPDFPCGLCLFVAIIVLTGCASVEPGTPVARHGDEIVIAGRMFRTGTPVVLWTDPGGYDAYRVERRFVPLGEAGWEHSKDQLDSPNRFGLREAGLSEAELERVRGGGWDLPLLRKQLDQLVIHYDACGLSRECFRVLHDQRGLSAHFLIDIDGTIYQTLDVKERAWHAGPANTRSVGVEIANVGAYDLGSDDPTLDRWYARDADGRTRITIPDELGDGGVRTPRFVGRPARDEPILGTVQGRELRQYDLTGEQYDALIRLTAALHRALPGIALEVPRDADGRVIQHTLPRDRLEAFRGLVGHHHWSEAKVDPGPAFDWDRVLDGAQALLGGH